MTDTTESLPNTLRDSTVLVLNNNNDDVANQRRSTARDVPDVRMPKLKRAIERTVDKCISAVSVRLFLKNLEMLKSVTEKESVKKLHIEFSEKLATSINEEVNLLLKEEKIADLLRELDMAVWRSSGGAGCKVAWRPSGVPSKDVVAHLIPAWLNEKEKLETIFKEETEDSNQWRKKIMEHRVSLETNLRRATDNQARISQMLSDVEKLHAGI